MQPEITQIAPNDIWIVHRDAKYFIRYDAGAHQHIWREDEIAAHDAQQILAATPNTVMPVIIKVLRQIQQQQQKAGVSRPQSNWQRDTKNAL